jgi:hypothetical protein
VRAPCTRVIKPWEVGTSGENGDDGDGAGGESWAEKSLWRARGGRFPLTVAAQSTCRWEGLADRLASA